MIKHLSFPATSALYLSSWNHFLNDRKDLCECSFVTLLHLYSLVLLFSGADAAAVAEDLGQEDAAETGVQRV